MAKKTKTDSGAIHKRIAQRDKATLGKIVDLADAHLLAVDYLRAGGASETLNCGYGHGYSVREVLDSVQRVGLSPLRVVELPRRAGDPPSLVARTERVREVLGWRPRLDDLDGIVASSLNWERKLLQEPW